MDMLKVAFIIIAGLIASSPLIAAEDIGEREYTFKCAVCHGPDGKGDGPYAELLQITPTDLTMLKANNGGEFPFERVFQIIDGRTDIKAHGPRDMPIWGNEYTEEAIEYQGKLYNIYNAELFVQGRILSLIQYLQSIQKP